MDSITAIAEKDQFAKLAGVQIIEVAKGSAKAKMPITPHHLNGLGMVHGAAIFTLADLAFAAACNSHGLPAVAINVNISYLKATKSGTLLAEAFEVSPGKVGAYTIRITDDSGDLIALFQGLSYRKGPSA